MIFGWVFNRELRTLFGGAFSGFFQVRDDLEPAWTRGERQLLERMIANLIDNAIRYNERGGHVTMISRHLGRHLTQPQRARWVALLLETADEIHLPDDPEFRSAFVAYLEWGSRLAVINSQDGVAPPKPQPMPSWGWGEVGGPYRP